MKYVLVLFFLLVIEQVQGQAWINGDNKRANITLSSNFESIGVGINYQFSVSEKPIFHQVNFNWGRLKNIDKILKSEGDIFLLGYALGYNFFKNIQRAPIEMNASIGTNLGYETKNIESVFVQYREVQFIYGAQLNLLLTCKLSTRVGVGVNYYFSFLFNSIYDSNTYNSLGLNILFVI